MLIKEQGQATVEMALVLPVLLLLLTGIIQFGIIFNAYITVAHASREGARVAAVGGSDSEITTTVLQRAENLANEQLAVQITPFARTRGTPVTVQVDYSIPVEIPLIADLLPNPFVISAQTVMRTE